MLKRRIIPKLLFETESSCGASRLVTTRRFASAAPVGDLVSQAKIYQAQAADELIFLDLTATFEQRKPSADVVSKASREIFMPMTVGGGIKTLSDIRLMLECGADKVSINSAALVSPTLISEAANIFGSQCIVVSIDYRCEPNEKSIVLSHRGTRSTKFSAVEWAIEAANLGAGEIILTSIDMDGSQQGLDLKTIRAVTGAVKIPVIASGGCGAIRHIAEALNNSGADAVAAGTFFSRKDQNLLQARSHIRNLGIPVRSGL